MSFWQAVGLYMAIGLFSGTLQVLAVFGDYSQKLTKLIFDPDFLTEYLVFAILWPVWIVLRIVTAPWILAEVFQRKKRSQK
jgi:hypothetical protein